MLLALGLGHTTPVTRYGLAFEGKQSSFKNQVATLSSPRRIRLRFIRRHRVNSVSNEEAVQLPLLARDGELTMKVARKARCASERPCV